MEINKSIEDLFFLCYNLNIGDKMLYTKHLILRKAQKSDLYDIFNNIWSDKNIYENMFFEPTTNIEEAKKRLNRTIEYQNNNYAYFVCYNRSLPLIIK